MFDLFYNICICLTAVVFFLSGSCCSCCRGGVVLLLLLLFNCVSRAVMVFH